MGWKIYFWILAILLAASTALIAADSLGVLFPEEGPLLDETWTWLDSLGILISWIGIVGLFGLAYQKVIWKQKFWKGWFVFVLIFDISYEVHEFSPEDFVAEDVWYYIIAYSFLLSYYVALYLYGYKSDSIWNPHERDHET
jgi:hypothetical protein